MDLFENVKVEKNATFISMERLQVVISFLPTELKKH